MPSDLALSVFKHHYIFDFSAVAVLNGEVDIIF